MSIYIHFKNQTWADQKAVSHDAPNGRVFIGAGYACKLRNTLDCSALLQSAIS